MQSNNIRFVQVEAVGNYGENTSTHIINLAHIADINVNARYNTVIVSMVTGETIRTTAENARTLLLLTGNGVSLTAPATTPRERPAYCDTPGANRAVYLDAQRGMFAAARAAGLDTNDRDGMIEAINHLLNIEITSRTQLTPREMHLLIVMIEAGFLLPGWRPNRQADRAALLRAA